MKIGLFSFLISLSFSAHSQEEVGAQIDQTEFQYQQEQLDSERESPPLPLDNTTTYEDEIEDWEETEENLEEEEDQNIPSDEELYQE
jgi:hypothetical protein